MTPTSHVKASVALTSVGDSCATSQVELKAQSPPMRFDGDVVTSLKLLGDHYGGSLALPFALGAVLSRPFPIRLLLVSSSWLPSSISR